MYEVKQNTKVLVHGNIHYALYQAMLGYTKFKDLRHNPWEARGVQKCLINGWLKRVKRGHYTITDQGREMLDLLGVFLETPVVKDKQGFMSRKEFNFYCPKYLKDEYYYPTVYRSRSYVAVPKHHKMNRRWATYFLTHIW